MYSVVLMMAMTAAPEAPSFNGLFSRMFSGGGCCSSSCCGGSASYSSGCCGGSCYGASYSSCTGYGAPYSSCTGYAAPYSSCSGYGIYGAGCTGASYYQPTWTTGHAYQSWYQGGCTGSSCCGYSSGSYSQAPYSSCSGYGIYGAGMAYPTQSSGCYGGGMPQASSSNLVMPAIEEHAAEKRPSATQAIITVRLPADAKLFAQGQATDLASAERQFVTPDLTNGTNYQYTFKIEYTRDGKPYTDTKDLVIKAGDRKTVDFEDRSLPKQMERLSSR